eukprot:XP_011661357.1 PREDICTED: uncharacterized protein LOC105436962 [Strongylocentrotus purpuratus]
MSPSSVSVRTAHYTLHVVYLWPVYGTCACAIHHQRSMSCMLASCLQRPRSSRRWLNDLLVDVDAVTPSLHQNLTLIMQNTSVDLIRMDLKPVSLVRRLKKDVSKLQRIQN